MTANEGLQKPNFYVINLVGCNWEVPVRYQDMAPLGVGAFSQVWFVSYIIGVGTWGRGGLGPSLS